MSTYVFISRHTDPFDDGGSEITAHEWIECVDAEPDFRAPTESESEWLSGHARILTGHSIPFAFDFVNDQVQVKSPDAPTIARMNRLASKLSASIFSETGEIFTESGNHAGFLPGFP